ncbi:MAG TPA: XylR family transcriptional regulator [Lacipirellulaceae bacterium]|nr:XylR family transcriptional regulator [Lacipirellulaceae bacterium]HMP05906.1 XylR family transcriptional regulator [Lacipirellulaceae bacterium]
MSKIKRIALVFPVFSPHLEPMTQGILKYARERGGWHFAYSPDGASVSLKSLQRWKGDGAIAFIGTEAEVKLARSLKVPVVNISASRFDTRLATVTSDNYKIGSIAAAHLLSLKFQRFAYFGIRDAWYSQERCRGFVDAIEHAGYTCATKSESFCPDATTFSQLEHRSLKDWIKRLQLPVGLLAVQDYRARLVMEVCKDIGIRVPDEMAVIGINNDPVACLFCSPSLTSVAHDGVKVGFEAAKLLDALMSSRADKSQIQLIPPIGVVERESTDTLAVDNVMLRQTIELINRRYADDIGIDQISAHLDVSRRWLEKLFKHHLDCSPHEYLSRVRITEARRLLAKKPPIKLKDIAASCGFSDTRRLSKVFRRLVGVSPRQYLTEINNRQQKEG